MSQKEELQLILTLLAKYGLPVSPILEYAISEKLEECAEDGGGVAAPSWTEEEEPSSTVDNAGGSDEDSLPDEYVQPECEEEEQPEREEEQPDYEDKLSEYEDEQSEYEEKEQPQCEVEATEEQEPLDFFVENTSTRCAIYNRWNVQVFAGTGKLKVFHGKVFRFNYDVDRYLKVNRLTRHGNKWHWGEVVVLAYSSSPLFSVLRPESYLEQMEDLVAVESAGDARVYVNKRWYDRNGNLANESIVDEYSDYFDREELMCHVAVRSSYEPKGKLKKIKEAVQCSYDFLWMTAIVDFMSQRTGSSTRSFDELACMMLAEAWEALGRTPELRQKESDVLLDGIGYLMEESRTNMGKALTWSSSREEVFEAIKDYPMAGAFEETVDDLLATSPYDILRIWIKQDDDEVLVERSQKYQGACLYALYPHMRDACIKVNPNWRWGLFKESGNLRPYLVEQYKQFLRNNG